MHLIGTYFHILIWVTVSHTLGIMNVSNCLLIFFKLIFIGKIDIELGNGWLFSIGNGVAIQPLENGRKSPAKLL